MHHLSLQLYSLPDGRSFWEFYIDDVALHQYIQKKFRIEVLNSLIGSLGAFNAPDTDRLTLKQLLQQPITDAEIATAYHLENEGQIAYYREDLRKVLVYICSACGDEGCGGITLEVQKTDDKYLWNIDGLFFSFEAKAYKEVLENVLHQI
jgi:hypothetical protein